MPETWKPKQHNLLVDEQTKTDVQRSVISNKVTGDLALRQCGYNDWMELFAYYGVLCPALKVIWV